MKAKLKMEWPADVLKTYKFYSENGKRLAIFAVPEYVQNEKFGLLHIYVTECSEKDQFDKNVANIAFSVAIGSPAAAKKLLKVNVKKVAEIGFAEGKSKKTFLQYCRGKFLTMGKSTVAIEYPALFKGKIPVRIYEKKGTIIHKLSHPINK